MNSILLSQAKVLAPSILFAQSHGINVTRYMKRLHIPINYLDIQCAPIGKFSQYWGFFNLIEASEGIENLGLLMGTTQNLDDMGPVGYYPRREPTLYRALISYAYWLPLVVQSTSFQIDKNDEWTTLSYVRPHIVQCRGSDQQAIKYLLTLIDLVDGEIPPLKEMQLVSLESKQATEILQSYQCPISYSQEQTSVTIPTRLLSATLKPASSPLKQATEKDNYLKADFPEQVRAMIESHMSCDHSLSIEELAYILGTSRSTLHRQLRQFDTSFSRILSDARYEHATNLLKMPSPVIKEVAHLTGYSSATAFTRAFKAMSGLSPIEFIEQEKYN